MNLKALLLALSLLSMLVLPILPANAGMTVPNPLQYTYLTTGGAETCDPAWAYDTASAEIIFNVYMCLVDFDFVYYDRFVEEISDWWPGKGENAGDVITPLDPACWEFDNLAPVDLALPVGTVWDRKYIEWTLDSWVDNGDGILGYCDTVTMKWLYDPVFPGWEILEFHVDGVIVLCGTYYTLRLQPTFLDSTWKFHIRKGIKWQDPDYGAVTPFDVEVSLERGMLMDHAGGPQWMFFEPLTLGFSTRSGVWNRLGTGAYNPAYPDGTKKVARWIDDAIESDEEFVYFNLDQPYIPFMQILSQSWGSVMSHKWLYDINAWDLGWHCPYNTYAGYSSWVAYNNPPTPGPVGDDSMGSGPYYIDYVDLSSGYHRLESFDNYYFGWDRAHCDTIIHEVDLNWATRKARFLTNDPATQADQVTVLRGDVNDAELLTAIADGRVRYLPHLATLSADAIFWSYDFDPTSPYMHHFGDGVSTAEAVANTTLLSDIHMRLALTYCWNATEFIQDYYQGEAATLHNPIIYGIASANSTKHTTMYYEKDIELATYHFKMAWGGIDYEPDGVCDVPGLVWQLGFHVTLVPFPDAAPRTEPCYMTETVVENEIPWEVPVACVDVEVFPLGWNPGLTAMYQEMLGAYVVGWLADFPHPHNWVMPFEHTEGDFSYFQGIHYGHDTFGNVVELNWHPDGNYGPIPYTNYAGETVTELNNTYVDGLIATGIGLSGDIAERCYTELMDIYYAEDASRMTYQPEGRRYERTWVYGWFYNSIYPGLMFYGPPHTMNLFKADPQTMWEDFKPSIRIKFKDTMACWTIVITFDVSQFGTYPVSFNLETTWWDQSGNQHSFIYTNEWTEAGGTDGYHWEKEVDTDMVGAWGVAAKAEVEFVPWVGLYKVDSDLTNDKLTAMAARKGGDLGGKVGFVPKYFAFDGKVDAFDLALFINAQKYYKTPPDPTATNPYA